MLMLIDWMPLKNFVYNAYTRYTTLLDIYEILSRTITYCP